MKQMHLKKKILGGPNSNSQNAARKEFTSKKNEEDDKVNKTDYYKFYLNNA